MISLFFTRDITALPTGRSQINFHLAENQRNDQNFREIIDAFLRPAEEDLLQLGRVRCPSCKYIVDSLRSWLLKHPSKDWIVYTGIQICIRFKIHTPQTVLL